MVNKIVFLDMDGVLNSRDWNRRRPSVDKTSWLKRCWQYDIDPVCAKLLHDLLIDTDAHVVISSTWRILNTYEQVAGYIKDVIPEFESERVIGATVKNLPAEYRDNLIKRVGRGDEVNYWMEQNDFTGNYVIFDDDSDFHEDQPFVWVSHDFGLKAAHCETARQYLNGER